MTTILAALDSSPSARPVLAAAHAVAELAGAQVVELRLPEHLGTPVDGIVAAAEAADVTLLALGSQGNHAAGRIGGTALSVIGRLHKPALVVPPGSAPIGAVARVLAPLEGSRETSDAVASVLRLATQRALDVVALHVDPPDRVPAFQDQAHHWFEAWATEFAARFVDLPPHRVVVIQRFGSAPEAVVEAAGGVGADLIVLAWRQDLSPGRAAVVRSALTTSPVPVLLVPTAGRQSTGGV